MTKRIKYPIIPGQKFFRLTVIEFSHRVRNHRYVKCICDCNLSKYVVIRLTHLTSGKIKSCGCFNNESRRINNTIHGRQCFSSAFNFRYG